MFPAFQHSLAPVGSREDFEIGHETFGPDVSFAAGRSDFLAMMEDFAARGDEGLCNVEGGVCAFREAEGEVDGTLFGGREKGGSLWAAYHEGTGDVVQDVGRNPGDVVSLWVPVFLSFFSYQI